MVSNVSSKLRTAALIITLEFLDALAFAKGGKPDKPEKTVGRRRLPIKKNSTHIWHRARIETGPSKFEASALAHHCVIPAEITVFLFTVDFPDI